MELRLRRRFKGQKYTIGDLFVGSEKICEILEDADRGLKDSDPIERIEKKKICGQTAIPYGRYLIDMNTVSPKFKGRSWAKPYGGKLPRLENVKGYEGVLIHPGNRPEDTYGCLLPGWNKVKGQVVNSTEAFDKLMNNYLLPAHNKGEEIALTIE